MNDASTDKARILLIDDQEALTAGLAAALASHFQKQAIEIDRWTPNAKDGDPFERLREKVSKGVELVITDYNLTLSMNGLMGPAIQSWCQRNLIPVGEYSRGHQKELATEPSLFEILIPYETDPDVADQKAAAVIYGIFSGFSEIRTAIEGMNVAGLNLSTISAELLGRLDDEPTLSLYFSRLISSNPSVRDHLIRISNKEDEADFAHTLAYVIGHVLLNLVLAYPGPVLSRDVLAAYLSVSREEADEIVAKAGVAPYTGPFSEVEPYVWRDDVDAALLKVVDDDTQVKAEIFNRFAASIILGREPTRHGCVREGCEGQRGGYWCPFTKRTVCSREDCSEPSTAWIPDGADLCRVEADFFQEFAPFLDG